MHTSTRTCSAALQAATLHTRPPLHIHDVAIVGGGIIGLACNRELLHRHPHLNTILLEKQHTLGAHQSTHNSGVIHAGIYYKEGSLRAKLCHIGTRKLYAYCDEHQIPYKRVGKLIVALNDTEAKQIDVLHKRALANGVSDVIVHDGQAAIHAVEPNISGVRALESPSTGIINFESVVHSYAKDVRQAGGSIQTDYNVRHVEWNKDGEGKYVTLRDNNDNAVNARHVLCAGGLYSDRLAELFGSINKTQIVPFRGVWLKLAAKYRNIITRNIYPVPDPAFPFLGIHMTPRLDGSIYVGPNASLAFAREGYRFTDVNMRDLMESLRHKGLQKMIGKHFRFGIHEYMCELMPRMFTLPLLKQYCPSAEWSMVDGYETGVRAQVMGDDGALVEDFVMDEQGNEVVHLRNAPSPAATSSLAIAETVVDRCEQVFRWRR